MENNENVVVPILPDEDSAQKIIEDLKVKHDAEMKEEQTKYNALLRAYTMGTPAAADVEKPKTQEDLKTEFEQNIKDVYENKLPDLEQAKRIIDINEYRENAGERNIFLPADGTPSQEDLASSEKVRDLLTYCVNECDGDPDVYKALLKSKLNDNKYI